MSLFGTAFAPPAYSRGEEICPKWFWASDETIDLTDSERDLICGDADNPAWQVIPTFQAKSFFKGFLSQRGYYSPGFEDAAEGVVVNIGPRSYIKGYTIQGVPGGVKSLEKNRTFLGREATPAQFDKVESWIKSQLGNSGYPCGEVKLTYRPDTEAIQVEVSPGTKKVFGPVQYAKLDVFDGEILQRYEPFFPDGEYDTRKLTLATRRATADGTVLAVNYVPYCGQEFSLKQKMTPGEPNLLRFGVGINTEGLLLTKVEYQRSRLGQYASSFYTRLYASYLDQELVIGGKWFLNQIPDQVYLNPELKVTRENEKKVETVQGDLKTGPVWQIDRGNHSYKFSVAPTLTHFATIRGEGPNYARALSVQTALGLRRHNHEFYASSPETGYELGVTGGFYDKKWLSDFTAQKYTIHGEVLANVGGFSPPVLVAGFRMQGISTVTSNPDELPSSLRDFFGGSRDMRGFARGELPNNEGGSLSSWYSGLEFRHIIASFSYVQPLVFVDAIKTGRESVSLDKPLYWSPGLGARLELPFFVIRLTAAKGFIENPDPDLSPGSHWQFYLSLGEEF